MTRKRMAYRAKNPIQIGKRFGSLVLIQIVRAEDRHKALVVCNCGNYKIVEIASLRKGASTSCGCERKRLSSIRNKTHGESHRTRAYGIWCAMKERCYNPNNEAYPRYAGRGIIVCERWHTYENFRSDMGEPPLGMSLDRIDNDGNYEPGNCKWSTYREQAANRRSTRWVILGGERVPNAEACRRIGIQNSATHKWAKRMGKTVQDGVDFYAAKYADRIR